MARLPCAALRHRRPQAAAALPPTARRQHGLPRLLRRVESALVQPAQVAPAKRTLERRRRLERWQQPSLGRKLRLPLTLVRVVSALRTMFKALLVAAPPLLEICITNETKITEWCQPCGH